LPLKQRAKRKPRWRLSGRAEADIVHILTISEQRWGIEGMARYSATLVAAMRQVAADPEGFATRDRSELMSGIRSFGIRHVRVPTKSKVKKPVHVLYYRAVEPGLIEIVRVLHEHMEPSRHLSENDD
jgi:toxin ParE1/3/4